MKIIYVLLISLFLLQAVVAAEVDWASKETPVEDPIGLGERLALIDYFQSIEVALTPGMSLGELRELYWQRHMAEEQRLQLYNELVDKWKVKDLAEDLDYGRLVTKKIEAIRKVNQQRLNHGLKPLGPNGELPEGEAVVEKQAEKEKQQQQQQQPQIAAQPVIGKTVSNNSDPAEKAPQSDEITDAGKFIEPVEGK